MERKKLKLKDMDITPLFENELSKVLGGFVAYTSGAGSATVAPSASASNCKGNDVDVTSDSDNESD